MSVRSSRIIRRILYVLVALVVIGFVVTRFFPSKKASNYVTAKVEKSEVSQTVALTGTTEPTTRYQLQFQRSGKLQQLLVKKGDKVHTGDILAVLEHSDLDYQLEAQKAALRVVQAQLAKSYAGPRDEEIAINQLKIDMAQMDAQNASQSRKNLLNIARRNVDSAQVVLDNSLVAIQQAQDDLTYAQQFGQDTSAALAALDVAQAAQQKARDAYEKAFLDYQRQRDDLNSGVDKSDVNIQVAQEQLNLLSAKPRDVDVAPTQAQIDQAWQSVHLSEYQLQQATLKAPSDGVVTDIAYDVGETVSVAQPFIRIDATNYYVKALVSEADISKIQQGQAVTMTFDAFDLTKEFVGLVNEISPAETVVQGVVYYEVKIQFDLQGALVKSGMTANVTIKTQTKNGAVAVPTRAIQYEGNQAYVQVLTVDEKSKEEKVERRNVTLGLQGDENAEIVSGLQEGEQVVTFTKV